MDEQRLVPIGKNRLWHFADFVQVLAIVYKLLSSHQLPRNRPRTIYLVIALLFSGLLVIAVCRIDRIAQR